MRSCPDTDIDSSEELVAYLMIIIGPYCTVKLEAES